MMQGDSYNLGFSVLNNAGQPITPDDINDMEITIGPIRKTYRGAGVSFNEGKWMISLSQQETFGVWPASVKAQIRVMWKNGVIEGKPIHGLRMTESISKEVL
jgi:hypothetical protein